MSDPKQVMNDYEAEKEKQRGMFLELYNKGTNKFNEFFKEPKPYQNIPTLVPQPFDEWYAALFKDLYLPKPETPFSVKTDRLNKIIQYGNFGVSQPTGGFVLEKYIDKETIQNQYIKAVQGEKTTFYETDKEDYDPILMVITEPFRYDFFLDNQLFKDAKLTYIVLSSDEKGPLCGLLYNERFSTKYIINQLVSTFTTGTTAYFELVPKVSGGASAQVYKVGNNEKMTINKDLSSELFKKAGTPQEVRDLQGMVQPEKRVAKNNSQTVQPTSSLIIANFHGDSKGIVKEFETFIKEAKEKRVSFITGDSNITKKKTKEKLSTNEVLTRNGVSNFADNDQLIQKTRVECDILLNNQLNKSGLTEDVDGMFVADLNKSSVPISSYKKTKPFEAFVTLYTPQTPMLGDHSVVGMNNRFTLLSATGSLMDHKTRGIFGDKTTWGNVNIPAFHKTVGEQYTLEWIHIYQQWVDPPPSDSPPLFKKYLKDMGKTDKDLEDLNFHMFDNKMENLFMEHERPSHSNVVKPVSVKPVNVKPVNVNPVNVKPVSVKPVSRLSRFFTLPKSQKNIKQQWNNHRKQATTDRLELGGSKKRKGSVSKKRKRRSVRRSVRKRR